MLFPVAHMFTQTKIIAEDSNGPLYVSLYLFSIKHSLKNISMSLVKRSFQASGIQ